MHFLYKKNMKLNDVYLGNCFDLIKNLEDNSIELIVCDGPYGVTDFEWDKIPNIREFNLSLIKEFSRVLKPGGSLYLFGKPNCFNVDDTEKYLKYMDTINWHQPSRLAQGRLQWTKTMTS